MHPRYLTAGSLALAVGILVGTFVAQDYARAGDDARTARDCLHTGLCRATDSSLRSQIATAESTQNVLLLFLGILALFTIAGVVLLVIGIRTPAPASVAKQPRTRAQLAHFLASSVLAFAGLAILAYPMLTSWSSPIPFQNLAGGLALFLTGAAWQITTERARMAA